MNVRTLSLFASIVLCVLILAAMSQVFNWRAPSQPVLHGNATTTLIALPGKKLQLMTTSGIESWYTNSTFRFSFRLPDGFLAGEGNPGVPGSRAVVLTDDAGVRRLVLYVLPVKGITTLAEADLAANLPDGHVRNVREGFIGGVVRGLSFAYTDGSVERAAFWFMYAGHVYEFSTAVEDAVLLEFVLSSWRFAPPTPPKPRQGIRP